MKYLALVAVLSGCSPALQLAGVPGPVADMVERVSCDVVLPARFLDEHEEIKDAALEIIREYCGMRHGFMALTYQCPLTKGYAYAPADDLFRRAYRAECG